MKNITISQLKPMPGFVLVEPAKSEETTASGIILPENNSEKPQYGKVLALGELCTDDCCGDECCGGGCCSDYEEGSEKKKKVEECCDDSEIKVGDTVVYKKWGGNEVMINDVEYQFLKYEDILAVVTKK